MKIAFYTPRVSHLKAGASGDRILVSRLLDGLRQRGHEVEVISRVGVYDFWRGRVTARQLLAEAISVRRRARRFGPDAWLIYGSSTTYPDVFGWWQRPARYVLLNTTGGRPVRLDRRWQWLFTQLHRRSLARANAVIAVRAKSADLLGAAGVEDPRLRLLPPAVESFGAMPSQEAARLRLGLPSAVPIVLCVGRMTAPRPDGTPWKTEWLLALVDAFADAPVAPGTLLVLVGDGDGRSRVEERIAARGLTGRVVLAGAVPHGEMRWHYAAADLFAYLATSDRIWHAAMEAMACGRPVLTLRTRSSALVVDHGRTGLLAEDPDQFGEHLVALTRDRARCAALGQAARAGVAEAHSIERRVVQIEALLAGRAEPRLGPRRTNGRSPRAARRVLVTGGLGFIGSFVSERLAARGDRVTIVDSGVSSVIEPGATTLGRAPSAACRSASSSSWPTSG